MRSPDGHLVQFLHGAAKRRRLSSRHIPLYDILPMIGFKFYKCKDKINNPENGLPGIAAARL